MFGEARITGPLLRAALRLQGRADSAAEKVGLAQLGAGLAQQRIGRGRVEEEVRQREVLQEGLAIEGERLAAAHRHGDANRRACAWASARSSQCSLLPRMRLNTGALAEYIDRLMAGVYCIGLGRIAAPRPAEGRGGAESPLP